MRYSIGGKLEPSNWTAEVIAEEDPSDGAVSTAKPYTYLDVLCRF